MVKCEEKNYLKFDDVDLYNISLNNNVQYIREVADIIKSSRSIYLSI